MRKATRPQSPRRKADEDEDEPRPILEVRPDEPEEPEEDEDAVGE